MQITQAHHKINNVDCAKIGQRLGKLRIMKIISQKARKKNSTFWKIHYFCSITQNYAIYANYRDASTKNFRCSSLRTLVTLLIRNGEPAQCRRPAPAAVAPLAAQVGARRRQPLLP